MPKSNQQILEDLIQQLVEAVEAIEEEEDTFEATYADVAEMRDRERCKRYRTNKEWLKEDKVKIKD